MFGWSQREAERGGEAERGRAGAAAGAVVHDTAQVHVLGLLVTDTFRWKRDWASWRIRFAYSNEHPGQSFRDVAVFVREAAATHCQYRCECAEIVLYLAQADDVRGVFRAYGGVPHGMGQISAIQSRETYLQAATFAAELAAMSRVPDRTAEDEVMSLPDLAWHVEGYGMSRIATATLRGRRIVVRLGIVSGQDLWLVDVNGHPACARFRSRVDAMSKMGIAAALKVYETRPRQR